MNTFYRFIGILSIYLLFFALTSCEQDKEELIAFKVVVKSGEGGEATVSSNEVISGEEVVLSATPESGYRFLNWTSNGVEVSKDNPYTFAVNNDIELQANFEKDIYKLEVIAGEGGRAMVYPKEVLNGEEVTLYAVPEDDYSFLNWIIEGEDKKEIIQLNPYTLAINENLKIKATFISYNVKVMAGEGGTAVASRSRVGYNGKVTLTATMEEGYSFVNWTMNGKEVSVSNPYTATIVEDSEYVATFKKYSENGYVYVDLGLSVKWATCNLGASSSEEYGDYYAWGETETKDMYSKSNYTFRFATSGSFDPTTLPLSSDVSNINMGGNWRMPTKLEVDELRSECVWIWETKNNICGYTIKSKKNGNFIFIPAAGYFGGDVYGANGGGYYWTGNPNTNDSFGAYSISFTEFSRNNRINTDNRYLGYTIRPVCD